MINCSKCKADKPRSEFSPGIKKNGLDSQCKACRNEYQTAKYRAGGAKAREYSRKQSKKEYRKDPTKQRAYYSSPGGRMSSYKSDAKRRDHEFEMTKEEFMLFWQKPCHYCGDSISTVGLDRVDNSKGYVLGNVVSCCTSCNLAKGKSTKEDFIRQCIKIADKKRGPESKTPAESIKNLIVRIKI